MQRTVRTRAGTIDYELIQTQRKNMELRVLWDGKLRLFTPRRAALKSADAFVIERAEWIKNTRETMLHCASQRAQEHPVADGAALLFEGRPTTLSVRQAQRNRIQFEDQTIWVSATKTDPDSVRAQLQHWFSQQARMRILERLDFFVPQVGRSPARVAIKAQRTRWGSCSRANNLNFNWKLIMAPPEALDYVVVHELCHLYEFNHSDKFWARVMSHQRDYLVWRAWLKEHGKLLEI